MQNVTGNVSSVTASESRNKFSNATRRCHQFRRYATSRTTTDDAKTRQFRWFLTNLWRKNKLPATSTTDIVKILCNVCATSAHTQYAECFRKTLYCFENVCEVVSSCVLKIRVSLVRFRDWPPNTQKPPSGGFCFW